MSNWIAITWESGRMLFLSAAVHGKSATFQHAAALDDPRQLTELLTRYRLSKAETVVVLNRSDVEVRPMLFPPVPADELPSLVKFQAAKEFNHYEPPSPIDFFVTSKLDNVSRSSLFPALKSTDLSAPTGAPKHLLASTLRHSTFQQIKTFCEEQNLVLRHIVLRPCASAALWRQVVCAEGQVPDQSVLLVELDKLETPQTAVYQGEPVFMRSPKIHCPADVSTPDFAARLLAELKRTRIAVRNEIQGIEVDEIVIFGSGAAYQSLTEQLTQGLDRPVKLFDPLQKLTINAEEADGRFAPLFGAIQQIARNEALQIDFCNPKKRTQNTGRRNLFTGITAAVLCLVVGLFGYVFYSRMALQSDIVKLTRKLNELKKTAGTVVEQKKQLDVIDAWQKDNVNWFEQLNWLSQKAPKAEDMMVREITFSSAGGGIITFSALLRDQSILASMVDRLRDADHALRTGASGADTHSRYKFRSAFTLLLSEEAVAADRGDLQKL